MTKLTNNFDEHYFLILDKLRKLKINNIVNNCKYEIDFKNIDARENLKYLSSIISSRYDLSITFDRRTDFAIELASFNSEYALSENVLHEIKKIVKKEEDYVKEVSELLGKLTLEDIKSLNQKYNSHEENDVNKEMPFTNSISELF
jgi:hypothetical protein